jgi:hypothetical protein
MTCIANMRRRQMIFLCILRSMILRRVAVENITLRLNAWVRRRFSMISPNL